MNLPFYWLGYKRLGLAFMLKSLIAVTLLSVLVGILPKGLEFGHVHPLVGAILVGFLTGSALLALFRQRRLAGRDRDCRALSARQDRVSRRLDTDDL